MLHDRSKNGIVLHSWTKKKVKFDGPDGSGFKWHYLREDMQYTFKTHSEDGSVMVWAGSAGSKRTSITVVKGNQDRFKNLENLQMYLPSFCE